MASATLDQIANSVELQAGGRAITVRRLSVRQILSLTREVFGGLDAIKLSAAQDALKGVGVTGLLPLFEDDRIGRILATVTAEDAEWCLDNLGVADIAALWQAFVDVNDVESVRLVFTQAAQRVLPPNSDVPSSAQTPS